MLLIDFYLTYLSFILTLTPAPLLLLLLLCFIRYRLLDLTFRFGSLEQSGKECTFVLDIEAIADITQMQSRTIDI